MITIGTWNLENLFRPGAEGGPTSEQAYWAKLAALAAGINVMTPDVLAVQEVGDAEALDDLLELLDGDWFRELAAPDRRGIRVGFVSRVPLSEPEQVSDYPEGVAPVQVNDAGEVVDRMARPALLVHARLGGSDVVLVSCHLKSKLLSYPGGRFSPKDEDERVRYSVFALARRAAEAATVRALATRVLGGDGQRRPTAVLGDLNDGVFAATTTLLLGPPGSEIGTAGFERPDDGDGARLWNVAPLIPEQSRHSRTYRGRPELIDHIMVSHALVGLLAEARTGDTRTGSIGDDPAERRDAPGSDHRPVVARLRIP